MSREILRRAGLHTTASSRKRSISSHPRNLHIHSSNSNPTPEYSPSSLLPPRRFLHYILQRDTDKMIPPNDIFIRTPNTAPVLTTLNYSEVETLLRQDSSTSEILTGTFVINALRDSTSDKLIRRERGVAPLVSRVSDPRVLAICDAESHGEVLEAGAAHCISPEEVAIELTSVEEYEAVVCTSVALEALRPLARVLKAKMPHERRGTVAPNIMGALRSALLNVEWEMVQSPNHPHYYNVTLPLIKSDFSATTIKDHVAIMFSEITNFCPAKKKAENFIERVEFNWMLREADSLDMSRETIHVDVREHNAALKPAVEVSVLKKRYSRDETWALREAAKDRAQYLDEEKDNIARYLDERWEQIAQGQS